MGAKAQETRVYDIPLRYFSEELNSARFCSELRLTFKSENHEVWGVWYRFHHGMSFWSYAEKITVSLTPIDENSTKVDIFSECGMPTQVIDWGKNARNAVNIFEHLEKYVPERANCTEAAGRPVTDDVIIDVEPKDTEEPKEITGGKICVSCGAGVKKGAVFCVVCGNKIEAPKKKVCKSCGAFSDSEDMFCSQCGTKF